jgi:hypothetical protein
MFDVISLYRKLALFLRPSICAGVGLGSSSMAFSDYSTLVGKRLLIAVKSVW